MIPEPGSAPLARLSASQASRMGAAGKLTTARRSDSRSSGPRSTSTPPVVGAGTPTPSCSATSAVTRALAVAVVASTGMPGGRVASSVRIRR